MLDYRSLDGGKVDFREYNGIAENIELRDMVKHDSNVYNAMIEESYWVFSWFRDGNSIVLRVDRDKLI